MTSPMSSRQYEKNDLISTFKNVFRCWRELDNNIYISYYLYANDGIVDLYVYCIHSIPVYYECPARTWPIESDNGYYSTKRVRVSCSSHVIPWMDVGKEWRRLNIGLK